MVSVTSVVNVSRNSFYFCRYVLAKEWVFWSEMGRVGRLIALVNQRASLVHGQSTMSVPPSLSHSPFLIPWYYYYYYCLSCLFFVCQYNKDKEKKEGVVYLSHNLHVFCHCCWMLIQILSFFFYLQPVIKPEIVLKQSLSGKTSTYKFNWSCRLMQITL